jgi:hypothetical protein
LPGSGTVGQALVSAVHKRQKFHALLLFVFGLQSSQQLAATINLEEQFSKNEKLCDLGSDQ